MGDGSMTDAPRPDVGAWRLDAEHAPLAQGLVVSAFAHLPEGCALLLTLPERSGGAWLASLRAVRPITPALGKADLGAAIAFTVSGLQAMGLDDAALRSFSTPFQEGMHQIDRKRRLSDLPKLGTVVDGGPAWSANVPDANPDPTDPTPTTTPATVHAILLLYAADSPALAATEKAALACLEGAGVRLARRIELSLRFDGENRAREHFGFADGMSQPVPFGGPIVTRDGAPFPEDKLHGVPAGEVLIGHVNAHGEPAQGPIVLADERSAMLRADAAPEGFRNLGLDGSYLVVRELRQDVASFWASMDRAAETLSGNHQGAEWLASKVVGRTLDGDVLVPGGALSPVDGQPRNDFTFLATDRHGLGCPLGSHIRRANPRDGLAPNDAAGPDLLAAAQNHRMLRRGRKYGPAIADPRHDDGAERGLLFMCINTDIARQFEFVQQTWMLNTSFATLLDETDPLMGPAGRFTIPTDPLRSRPSVATFIHFAGGEYFFLPSLPALDYLQALPAPSS